MKNITPLGNCCLYQPIGGTWLDSHERGRSFKLFTPNNPNYRYINNLFFMYNILK